MAEEEDSVLAIEDVIQSIDEEKAIVMGGIDNRDCCSFTKGYMKRQALYTCRTCLDISTVNAGFCYPCLINCHQGHDTVELYTKRNFRCDCGNAKFGNRKCLLWEEKDDENVENRYNMNFSNRYCVCKRPYPDEEYEGNEEMIQCGICEDWFHVEHLNLSDGESAKSTDEYEEMTCFMCLQKHPFLYVYALQFKEQAKFTTITSSEENNIELENDYKPKRSKLDYTPMSENHQSVQMNECRLAQALMSCGFEVVDPVRLQLSDVGVSGEIRLSSVFWPAGWRESLCVCQVCKSLYKCSELEFLLDPQDTMPYYLNLGEEKALEIDKEETHALSEALSELPHSVAINVAEGVSQLKKALEEFLLRKRDRGHVITEAEVRSFFEDLRSQRHF